MKVKICKEAGCNNLIDSSSIYCDKHKREKKTPFQNAKRYNEELYKTQKWKMLRKEILKNNYCFKCGIDKNLQVHHIVRPKGNEILFFDINNLVPVCKDCHRIITQKEIATCI